MRPPILAFLLLLASPAMGAQTFSGTNALGKQQLPDSLTATVDASIAFEVEQINVPEGALKCSVYFETNAGRISVDRTLTDGSSTLSATTGIPVPADTWFDLDIGEGRGNASKIEKFFVASATTSTRFYVLCMGRSEP